jgi:hypothetical protein
VHRGEGKRAALTANTNVNISVSSVHSVVKLLAATVREGAILMLHVVQSPAQHTGAQGR